MNIPESLLNRPTDLARFNTKWVVVPSGCHEWQAFRDADGYGKFGIGGRLGGMKRAHVVAWSFANGRWPIPGEVVRHTCDNPPCCNPEHLLIGTKRDNEQDKVRRGRHHNQKKTACRNGHNYSIHGATNKRGRYCLTCVRKQSREWAAKHRAHVELADLAAAI